uniref:2'-phosphotransferase n=1 Tax=Brassica oleracea TaxID=3712 RepID=A0A3P6C5U7_BRAOL|nr:unnamed protein product [Brassica oleracea]
METSRLPLSSSIRGKLISAGYTSLSSISSVSSTDLARGDSLLIQKIVTDNVKITESEAFEILKMANQISGSSSCNGRSSSLVNGYNTGRLLRLPTLSIFPKFSPLSALMNSSNLSSSSKPAFSSFSQSSRSGGRGRGNERDNDRRRPQGRGGGGGGRGGGGGGGGGGDRIDALGRLLTRILRHMASELRLNMRGDGFVKAGDLLSLNLKTSANVQLKSHTIDEIREAVRRDNKQRFSLVEENGELLIRANQGHSITLLLYCLCLSVQTVESEKLLKPILSPEEAPVCVHGTYRKNLESILASGLKRMNRLHVHFSCGLPTDGEVISGMRRDVNLLIFLDIKKALEDGIAFYISDNKVILTEGVDGVVPVDYFQKIESWPSRQPIPF